MQVWESVSDVVVAAGQAGPSADPGLHHGQWTVWKRWEDSTQIKLVHEYFSTGSCFKKVLHLETLSNEMCSSFVLLISSSVFLLFICFRSGVLGWLQQANYSHCHRGRSGGSDSDCWVDLSVRQRQSQTRIRKNRNRIRFRQLRSSNNIDVKWFESLLQNTVVSNYILHMNLCFLITAVAELWLVFLSLISWMCLLERAPI